MSEGGGTSKDATDRDLEIGRMDLIARAAEIGAWDWDLLTGKIVHSPQAKAICGFPRDVELSVEDVRRLTHPDDVARTLASSTGSWPCRRRTTY